MRYLAPTFLAAVLVASAADGQPLYDWTADAPQSVPSAATTGAFTGPDLTASRPVVVDLDLLRSGPGLLAFPLPDGEPLWAVRIHFEDRGEGNVLWRGRTADEPPSNSVTLTLEAGWLVGTFGKVGGQSFELTSGPDGRGRVVRLPGNGASLPHVHLDHEDLVPHGHPSRQDARVSVASASMADADTDRNTSYTIDILMFWSRAAAKHDLWEGPPKTYVRAAVDYMNTVLGNNKLNLTIRLVHATRFPASVEQFVRKQHDHEWHTAIMDPLVAEIRFKHKADVVAWFANASTVTSQGRVECGAASRSWSKSGWASDIWNVATWSGAFVNLHCYDSLAETYRVMMHEVAHLLGANHNRSTEFYNDHPLFPYSYGYRGAQYYTIMTLPYQNQYAMPYFSSSVQRDSWTIGTSMEDNERTLLHTRAMAAKFDTYLGIPDAAPSDLTALERGRTSVELSWTDNSSNERFFEVFASVKGSEKWEAVAWPAADSTTLTLDGKLSLGKEYKLWVVAAWGLAESPKSNVVSVGPIGRPVAPSGLTATPTPGESGSVDLAWTDNSDDETGFAIRHRRLGESWNKLEGLAANTTTQTMSGLEPGRHYRFQVEASNQYGKRRSELVTVQLPEN
jgi:hypothetical protein